MKQIKQYHLLALYLLISKCSSSELTIICSQTPHPQLCTSLMSSVTTNTTTQPSTQKSSIRNIILRATKERVSMAHRLASAVDLSSLDDRAKSVWSLCVELYEDTIRKIDRAMDPSSSHDDSQTRLSAAMANQQACQSELKLMGGNRMNTLALQLDSTFESHNVSEQLSNLLAINKMTTGEVRCGKRNPRKWVSGSYRKLLQSSMVKANLVVAQDGSGNYMTISEAVAAAVKLRSDTSRFVIYVKAGTYKESVQITSSMKNVMMIGDGMDATVVTASKNVQDGWNTLTSATFTVQGDGFIARDMTFENTAGPQKQQAVAVVSSSDLSIFYRCSFKGYQDTLFVFSQRQFYRNCDIYGTVDFIFGDAVAMFQSCNMYVRKPLNGQQNVVTAQGRTDPNENTGISIHGCTVSAASDLQPVLASFKTYLGRPWKAYSRTAFMKTSIGSLVDPAGWLPWSGSFALSTLYYGEYMNSGGGAGTDGRVNWAGYHVMNASDAAKFFVRSFLGGGSWIAAAGIPYTAGF